MPARVERSNAAKVQRSFKSLLNKDIERVRWAYVGGLRIKRSEKVTVTVFGSVSNTERETAHLAIRPTT
jgi:hypothetical protein